MKERGAQGDRTTEQSDALCKPRFRRKVVKVRGG